jgi:heterotetrameric sarcosine oxidase gamma subunit
MTLTARSALGRNFDKHHSLPGPVGISLAERADIGGIWVTSATDAAMVLASLKVALGHELPRESGAMVRAGECAAIWMSPRAWLLRCPPAAEAEMIDRVAAAFPDRLAHASAFTDFLCWYSLDGDSAADFLKQGGFLSLAKAGLRAGHAKRTLIAGIPAILCHESHAHWLVGVERSRAAYFHGWLTSLVTV